MQSLLAFRLTSLLLLAINGSEVQSREQSLEDECASNENRLIGSVSIDIHPIFDEANPKENNWLFKTVNYLHINTDESIIRKDLLFKEGDLYDEKLLQQSERILRTRRYLNYATITPQQECTLSQKIKVDVREVWTLVPGATFARTGGNSKYSYGLSDSNFLGLGKTLEVKHTSTSQRTGNLFKYYDPNSGILDSTVLLQYENNSDGIAKSAAFIKPFIAFETEWSAGISHDQYQQESVLYNAGEVANRFAHNNLNESIFYGIKIDTSNDETVHRIIAGYNRSQDNFLPILSSSAPSMLIPRDREFNYPWVEYQYIADDYLKANNIQQINRVEDINLGSEIRFRLGYASSRYSVYDKSIIFDSSYEKGVALNENHLLLASVSAGGYYGLGEFYNSKLHAKATYHWRNFNRGQFFVGITAARGNNLFQDSPFELGGDTGLRGYPAFYQAGDRLQLLTIEQRFFGEKEWLSLFHIGGAVFYDEGRAWGESAIPQSQTTRLRDIGIGLRISGTRTGNREEGAHNVLHLDVASPLDGGNDISKFQWIVKVKKGF
jgi:outer membrane protein assembly factor BamA